MRLALNAIAIVLLFAIAAHAQEKLTVCSPAVISAVQIKESTTGFDVDVEYPVLCSPIATQSIRDFATKHLAEFKMGFPEHDRTLYSSKNEMIMDYNVWPSAKGRLTSVQLQIMIYTGGAHPNHWPVTWVFDMTTGHPIALKDIFTNLPEALTAIAPMVRGVLKKKMNDMYIEDMATSGTLPKESNYHDFIINDDGIAFFFAPYQVGPYAAGQQVVTIPWEQIKPFLTPSISAMNH